MIMVLKEWKKLVPELYVSNRNVKKYALERLQKVKERALNANEQ